MAESDKPKALLGVPAASEELGVPEDFLRRGIEEGSIPNMRVGRLYKIPHWWIRQQLDGSPASKAT
jgi:excisionase family DNA binding protein